MKRNTRYCFEDNGCARMAMHITEYPITSNTVTANTIHMLGEFYSYCVSGCDGLT
jgi:hypothetical protein